MRSIHCRVLVGAVVLIGLGSTAPTAGAHTAPDLVAVPAGSTATVTFQPTHGCGTSPTVEVSIRVPAPGATAVAVPGWTERVTDQPGDRTVVEWTGGSLPADQTGAFPVSFVVPDRVGELLTFPAVQVCENGEELAWISGDPASATPAPRLLVLPAGTPPAATIDEVPADAPGRDQLSAIVDVDASAPSDPTTSVAPAAPAEDEVADPGAPAEPPEDDGAGGTGWVLPAAALAAVAVAAGGWFVVRGRSG